MKSRPELMLAIGHLLAAALFALGGWWLESTMMHAVAFTAGLVACVWLRLALYAAPPCSVCGNPSMGLCVEEDEDGIRNVYLCRSHINDRLEGKAWQ